MKRIVIAALLVSMSALAEEAAKVEEPAKAEVEVEGHQTWPSLNELWNDTDTGEELKRALVDGTLSAEILLGYEYSNLRGNTTDAANAVLTRTTVNYLTGTFKGFDAFVQAQYVGPINDHYSPENPNYDTVADPESFRFHQAYLAYSGYDSVGRAGSQEIILDNARFIGDVGWRLNQQSFNGASIANHSVTNLALYYAYTDSINDTSGNIDHDRQYNLLNAEYQLGESNKVSGFAYLQRNDNDTANEKVDTFGLRSWGKNDSLSHDVMVALQRDAYYANVFGEIGLDSLDLGGGVEYISGGGNNQERFQTLNGTAHKFNGWADQFLGTGGGLRGGLIDVYGQVSASPVENLKLAAIYHYFNTADKTDNGFQGRYGQEIDLLAKYPVCKNFDVITKFAYYKKGDNNVDNFTNDETVFWLRGILTF